MKPILFSSLSMLLVAAGLSWAARSPALAVAAYEVSQQSIPSSYDSAMKAGYTAVQNRDYPAALQNFRRALGLRPQDPYALRAIQNVEAYLERQKLQAVDSTYDRAMRIGYAAAQRRDYQTALINFRRALQERPNDRYALQAIQNMENFISRERPAAPWSQPALRPDQVPAVLLSEWRQAENRATCAALAPQTLGDYQDAQPRTAYFSGGWAIAYDNPGLPGRNPDGTFCPNCGRGAFGIAGTGVNVEPQDIRRWPQQRVWADGSAAGYGPTGGEGPGHLAYVQVKGQRCLYNVWSFLGQEHLESLLNQLRLVQAAP